MKRFLRCKAQLSLELSLLLFAVIMALAITAYMFLVNIDVSIQNISDSIDSVRQINFVSNTYVADSSTLHFTTNDIPSDTLNNTPNTLNNTPNNMLNTTNSTGSQWRWRWCWQWRWQHAWHWIWTVLQNAWSTIQHTCHHAWTYIWKHISHTR